MTTTPDDSDLDPLVEEISPRRPSRVWKIVSWFLVFIVLLAILCRGNATFRQETAVLLLRLESESGYHFRPLKAVFGIDLTLSADLAAERIARGDAWALNALLRGGLDPNTRTSAGDPLLIVAVTGGRRDLIGQLLAFGVDVNASGSDGNSALLLASQMGNTALVEILYTAGADINQANADGETALVIAAKSENVPLAQQLLNSGANVNLQDRQGNSPLLLAMEHNNATLTERFLQQGANPAGSKVGIPARQRAGTSGLLKQAQPLPTSLEQASDDLNIPAPEEEEMEVVDNMKLEPLPTPTTIPAAPSPRATSTVTRLRVIGSPVGRWTKHKTVTLDSVEVLVKNVGSFEAKDVTVKVVVPGGTVVDLNGPTSLRPNGQAKFSATPATIVTRDGTLAPKVNCSNCRS